MVVAPDAVVEMSNPACGDVLKLSLKLSGDRIEEIRFQARGCVSSVACASALTVLARGKTLRQAGVLEEEALVKAVGGLPQASTHAAHLALDALRAALEQIASKQ